jgi:hypothetical protein
MAAVYLVNLIPKQRPHDRGPFRRRTQPGHRRLVDLVTT